MVQMIRLIALIIMMLIVPTGAFAANTAKQVDFLISGHLQADGTANAGGKVYTCDAGTVCGPSTSDPKTTWQDSGKVSAETNPVILDSNGKANIYADGLYKFQIYDSDDVLIETIDNVSYVIPGTVVLTQATLTPSLQTIFISDDTYYCNAQSGAVTTDFSGVSAVGNTGKRFTFKKIDSTANTCTIDVLDAQTIDGATTAVLSNQYDDITIESNGNNWTEVRGMVWSRAATFHNTTSFFNSATFATGTLLGAPATSVWPSFSVHKGGSDQGSITSPATKVTWSTEEFDTNSDFASDRFTPTVAGKYLLIANLTFTNAVVNADIVLISIYKNGAEYKTVRMHMNAPAGADFEGNDIQIIADANGTTDYFEVFCETPDTVSTIEGDATDTWFSGSRIAQ